MFIVAAAYARPPARASHRLGTLFNLELVVLGALGLMLLVAPNAVAAGWPWKLPPALGQFYGCFFISFAVGAWLAAGESHRRTVQNFTLASLTLMVLVLVASVLHLDRFKMGPVTWLWFGAFTLGALAFAAALVIWQRGSELPAAPDAMPA